LYVNRNSSVIFIYNSWTEKHVSTVSEITKEIKRVIEWNESFLNDLWLYIKGSEWVWNLLISCLVQNLYWHRANNSCS